LAAHQRVGSAAWWPGEDFPRTAALKVRRHLLPPPAEGVGLALGDDGEGTDPLEDAAAALERERPRQPLWPYTWGRRFRFLGFPIDLLYRFAVTRTVVLGEEHLTGLPTRLIVAGTHHGFADLPLIRRGLRAGGTRLAERLVVATGAEGVDREGLYALYGILAFGLYPLRRLSERDDSLRDLVRLMEAGSALLIFPQGTHARPEQERADDPSVRFRTGVSHLAAQLDAAVLPFGLAGTERIVPPFVEGFRGRLIAGIPVSITRGPLAIAFGATVRREPGETPRAFAGRLQDASYALTRQAERALAGESAVRRAAAAGPAEP
jgi:1-acyl-sn-glycerol-3-phosphate acyltransferase